MKESTKFYIKIGLALITIVIGIHQLSQPIFSPRISSIEISPLFIQSVQDVGDNYETKYYRIFSLDYEIEPTLLPESDMTIKMPPNSDLFTPTSKFVEENPYIKFLGPEQIQTHSLLDTNEFNNIKFHIGVSGYNVKKIPLRLFFRNEISLECSRLEFSNNFWWSSETVPIGEIPKIECFTKTLGLGQIQESGIVFRFNELLIRNRGDLEVKGFSPRIYKNGPQVIVCENQRELAFIESRKESLGEGYISIDLKPGETRRMIVLKQDPEYTSKDISNIRFPNEQTIFNFTSPFCGADWNKFIQ